jgi:glycosyltransferase involved in cell wall biosynthesis
VDTYYRKASIFAMSSMHEGLPLVLIEALSHNLPLISYDCPYGPADIIEHNVNGLLAENGNKEALAQAILTLATDEAMRDRFRMAATDKIKEFYLNKISAQWDKILGDVRQRRG